MLYFQINKSTDKIEAIRSKSSQPSDSDDYKFVQTTRQVADEWLLKSYNTSELVDGVLVTKSFKKEAWITANIRRIRNVLLRNSDYLLLPDVINKLTEAEVTALLQYRQDLRDLPESYNTITTPVPIDWPTKPVLGTAIRRED